MSNNVIHAEHRFHNGLVIELNDDDLSIQLEEDLGAAVIILENIFHSGYSDELRKEIQDFLFG